MLETTCTGKMSVNACLKWSPPWLCLVVRFFCFACVSSRIFYNVTIHAIGIREMLRYPERERERERLCDGRLNSVDP